MEGGWVSPGHLGLCHCLHQALGSVGAGVCPRSGGDTELSQPAGSLAGQCPAGLGSSRPQLSQAPFSEPRCSSVASRGRLCVSPPLTRGDHPCGARSWPPPLAAFSAPAWCGEAVGCRPRSPECGRGNCTQRLPCRSPQAGRCRRKGDEVAQKPDRGQQTIKYRAFVKGGNVTLRLSQEVQGVLLAGGGPRRGSCAPKVPLPSPTLSSRVQARWGSWGPPSWGT